ncbi:Asp-tRNA(Asn)/Glu-tRNA(Gln) amidotransferase subunit GatC [Mucilaginibacter sp. Bleaf8]|uniref:Asp-tRNA(Asn)/Glu-tRNA(Gln) amidotransferase subunit GatC n=1 Tax=Mucilaginibacter sp. Bleaf8 TaxID=2834430 RepID=UPI001BCFD4BE|nr:Asp-tRNA(Asn)/Glu-tRNA(Gln) amidotransferase subunit GatC [Mucilaginibacter sp. Bleaf8]MBS7563502.1 Asp-tRNA(Asn)/Glu-tRNA(Gln) amidotransferase subunit GatC [Mucilaginibacter sp. Bleaf8]
MQIDKDTVNKIAHLARLDVTEQESQELIQDMSRILDFMAKLNEVDTSNVEPLVYMTNEVNVLREDIVKHEVTHQEGLQNAPEHDGQHFLVAKVIDKK